MCTDRQVKFEEHMTRSFKEFPVPDAVQSFYAKSMERLRYKMVLFWRYRHKDRKTDRQCKGLTDSQKDRQSEVQSVFAKSIERFR